MLIKWLDQKVFSNEHQTKLVFEFFIQIPWLNNLQRICDNASQFIASLIMYHGYHTGQGYQGF